MFKSSHALMVQGTTSDAGKSILVTAICRILARNGISTVPFKSQNMALNSAVTADGGEIGRAQAVQAQACYLAPHTLMNPVLLKPNSDLGSQVIVNGKSIGNMKAEKYHRYKPTLLTTVVDAFEQLKNRYTSVIIEGAGSPAEINLREHDIANMGLAQAVDCPVIIVCDIDRGGVFAHLYGTYELLSASEKKRVVGFVINRFRGDKTLLQSGLDWLEEKTTVPVLAVIPYIHNLHIEAEDSLSQNQSVQFEQSQNACLKVAVICYPKMSNHTDFDVLRIHPNVICHFVKNPDQLGNVDLIILPGSKNVRGDLAWLVHAGWKSAIDKHLRYGGRLLGICGGFQMLGDTIEDPSGIESTPGVSQALGYLRMDTQLKDNKILKNVSGIHLSSQSIVTGYEIHAGISTGEALTHPVFSLQSCESADTYFDGAMSNDKQVMGTYVHGLFDASYCLQALLAWAGLGSSPVFDYNALREREIDRLADIVEKELTLDALKKLLSLSKYDDNKNIDSSNL